jgi:hypothetical protein
MTKSTDFGRDLKELLIEITTTRAKSCEFQVPKNPSGGGVNLTEVNVTFRADKNGESVDVGQHPGLGGNCDGKESGWTYSEDRTTLLLCGTTCDALRRAPEAEVEVVLGCPTRSIMIF